MRWTTSLRVYPDPTSEVQDPQSVLCSRAVVPLPHGVQSRSAVAGAGRRTRLVRGHVVPACAARRAGGRGAEGRRAGAREGGRGRRAGPAHARREPVGAARRRGVGGDDPERRTTDHRTQGARHLMAKNFSGAAAKVGGITSGAKKGRGCLPKVIGGVIAAVILIVFLGYLFNFASTDANRIGLHYGGGVIEAKKFKSIIEPGSTNNLIGPGDTMYTYPIDQRSYIIGGAGADTSPDDEVTVVSKDNVRLGVRVQVYFTLNRDKDTLKQFHERIGLKTHAYTSAGWDDMLQSYFRPQIDRALAAVGTG